MFRGSQFKGKKTYTGHKLLKSSKNKVNSINIYNIVNFWYVRGPQKMHLAGHLRPAGRVFETPGVKYDNVIFNSNLTFEIAIWFPVCSKDGESDQNITPSHVFQKNVKQIIFFILLTGKNIFAIVRIKVSIPVNLFYSSQG